MDDMSYETFTNQESELDLRALFVEQLRLEFEDGDETLDAYIWFACATGGDHWFAFAVSDTLENPSEMLENSDLAEMRKLSIYLGDTWENIENGCPHCTTKRHRQTKLDLPLGVYKDVMAADDDRLAVLRDIGRWQGQQDIIEEATGIRMSLN